MPARRLRPIRSTTTPSSRCSNSPSHATAGQAPALRVRRRPRPRRPPPARPHLPAGLVDLQARPAQPRPATTPLLAARQWEADHFEDVPVLVVAVRARAPAGVPRGRRGRVLRQRVPGRAEPAARGVGARARRRRHDPCAVVGWEARRTLGLPRSVTPVAVVPLGWPRGSGRTAAGAAGRATSSTSTGSATSRFALPHDPPPRTPDMA